MCSFEPLTLAHIPFFAWQEVEDLLNAKLQQGLPAPKPSLAVSRMAKLTPLASPRTSTPRPPVSKVGDFWLGCSVDSGFIHALRSQVRIALGGSRFGWGHYLAVSTLVLVVVVVVVGVVLVWLHAYEASCAEPCDLQDFDSPRIRSRPVSPLLTSRTYDDNASSHAHGVNIGRTAETVTCQMDEVLDQICHMQQYVQVPSQATPCSCICCRPFLCLPRGLVIPLAAAWQCTCSLAAGLSHSLSTSQEHTFQTFWRWWSGAGS